MVVCTCGKPAVVKTSWTNRNPGRRFFGCPTIVSLFFGEMYITLKQCIVYLPQKSFVFLHIVLFQGSNCPFLGWLDPPMCARSVDIIPGLLRRMNALRGVVEELEEQRSKYKKYIIISWVWFALYVYFNV